MRFTVRSLGGKLIISAALTLLLCMALFAVTSWYLLKTFYEHQANSDARAHLASIETSYHTRSSQIIENLSAYANASDYSANNLQSIFLKFGNSLSDLAFVSNKSAVVDVQQDHLLKSALPGTGAVRQALQGKPATALQSIPANDCGAAARSCWFIEYAVPVHSKGEEQNGVLVGIQFISDEFANDLVPDTSWNVVLCESQQVVGTNIHGILLNNDAAKGRLCQPDTVAIIATTQHYLTFSGEAHTADQIPGSPSIAVVDVEPLYNISANPEKALEILLGTGVFYISLGVVVYMYVARTFFIRPIRRLQARISALVEDHGRTAVPASTIDELGMLARSFNLLSESLQTRETESNVITKQMSDLLKMSDVLISTLNLDHLLGEVVSRLGTIMRANNVSLLLYGREMLSPWAVAHWSDSHSNGYMPATSITQQYGAVTVHTDPDGDITMAATTKMIAMPAASPRPVPSSSDKRRAIRPHKLTSQPEPYGLRRPRIPRPALRDLDMILARMAMQKQKITYAEDIVRIYQEQGEAWARMALEAGYRSVIAVPLVLQEQPIGSIILYGNKPREVTGSDTFLLSTAAIQVAMAIQNTLLFVEVKDKNAALERVNNLKSQFLATVTHELRTPLHSIISYGALILEGFVDGELTAEQEEHIQFMVRRAEDLHHLVDDMLDLSKIEADRLEVKVEPLSLESNLVEVVNQLKPMANNKGLYLTLEIDDGLPMALADSYRLRQVVINMVSNALKFTEKGGVTIRCTRLERYDMLRVSVHDTGIGISPAALDYIFEAFRQADGSTTRRFGGTGLGLTIARKLIELQGGEVAVESIVGQGSTFSFSLPIAPSP
ncbi:MAG TPA: ATP-binding protein [Ktedonobacteraceae bacterium]|nr:ATP-binding protein [Ktedonobacteraceae bacterium]